MTTKTPNNSYLISRLAKYGLTLADAKFIVKDHNTGQPVERTIFSSDEFDNIVIHYHMLEGSPWTFKQNEKEKARKYERTRFKVVKDDMKYKSPKGSELLPFFPPKIIEAYQTNFSIDTLVLVEGEIKAFIGCLAGLYCIGLGSIHGFYGGADEERPYLKTLAPEIVSVIERCQVKNLIYLTDADTLTINYGVDKDLYQRPNSFYSAVRNFNKCVKPLLYNQPAKLSGVYYAHIQGKFNPESKGLDDLLCDHRAKQKEILLDLLQLDKAGKFFNCQNLQSMQETHLLKYFGLTDVKQFFDVYKDYLKDREFIFKKVKYYHDGERVITIKNYNLDEYLRVGSNYFRLINKTRLVEGLKIKTENIVPWNKAEIGLDHGKGALYNIRKYNDFINIPDWINHKVEIDNCYNVAKALPYKPTPGIFMNIVLFLQHICNDQEFITFDPTGKIVEFGKEGNTGTMVLDYLTIMVQHPNHLLPIPCLLSREQETGKTTFAQLICNMFDGNSTIIQTKDFTGDFNSHWAGKYVVVIDEGYFEDKKGSKEKIKQVSTSDTITLNTKGVAQKQIQNFSKFMICSNDEDDFVKIERDDTRFWIIKVKKIEKKDPDLKQKIFQEIPAFFHYLMTRKIFHERRTRTWFDSKFVMNESFKSMLESSKAQWKCDIDEAISLLFEKLQLNEILLAKNEILLLVQEMNKSTRLSSKSIGDYLKRDRQLLPEKQQRYSAFRIYKHNNFEPEEIQCNGRPYLFKREDWLLSD